jgi:hypothetical protein
LIRKLKLDIDKKDDADLLRFETLLFNRTIATLAQSWKTRSPQRSDAFFLADQVMRAKKGLDLWRGPTYEEVTQFYKLLWQVAMEVLKHRT